MRNTLILGLNRINFDLPIAGFALNEANGILIYRIQTFLGTDRSLPAGMIGALIAISAHTVEVFLPQLKAAVASQTEVPNKSLFDYE